MSEERIEEVENNNNNGLKGVGVILTIIALITGIAAIVKPMQNEIHSLNDRLTRTETRIEKSINELDTKLRTEMLTRDNNVVNSLDFVEKDLNNFKINSRRDLKNLKETIEREIDFLNLNEKYNTKESE